MMKSRYVAATLPWRGIERTLQCESSVKLLFVFAERILHNVIEEMGEFRS